MKKAVISVLATVSLIAMLPATALAAPQPSKPTQTIITGTVTDNGKDVKGAKITVVCNNHSRTAKTDANGEYSVTYPVSQCNDNTKATVVATKAGLGGVNSGTPSTYSNGKTEIDVAIVNVSLPEFGIATGFVASTAGAGAFMVMRRRQFSGKAL